MACGYLLGHDLAFLLSPEEYSMTNATIRYNIGRVAFDAKVLVFEVLQ